MESTPLYDNKDPLSIESYGKKMIGQTFRSIYEQSVKSGNIHTAQETTAAYVTRHENKNYKGGIGNLVEECWFG